MQIVKVRKAVHWSPLPLGVLKFNVDGVPRGKTVQRILMVFCAISKSDVFFMFSNHVGH